MLRRNNACLNLAALDREYEEASDSTLSMVPPKKRMSDPSLTSHDSNPRELKYVAPTNMKRTAPMAIPDTKPRPLHPCFSQDATSRRNYL
ncbi:hypothetical protein Ae201684P_021921 [Aphanomyces euteiches]|uniref:Uncharacterized protein n=1 Tax=Aphanomyces euteiches TaxID=100861 RepID=A0A6G0WST6_9STRA|nr:hypothetical protein Ae201684_011973 [Aphanomyces euteiches]KAH9056184.1 hypothetical protein Ae201684P_021921 [Aphanomyces euteiches]KAH9144425.1 hypothetical protein AeRB84_011650 [Aphanomyces euteiches]